jgi:anthranilate synthase/aminodeoxychorismate synthase-like glutamine amidotransferase
MKALVIDNYDSFTYNLVQYLGELGAEIDVVRNDVATVDELLARGVDRLVISPGPCTPAEAGISVEAARRFPEAGVPTLGVCLGHQSMVEAFGGRVVRGEPIHGKDAEVEHDGRTLFAGLPKPLTVGRYHSLITVMAVRLSGLPAEGVQFHPESVLTPAGKQMLANFLGVPAPAS